VRLSETAAAILQGFPDGWKFCGKTKSARWSQIGQAMPPPLAEAVARSIARQLAATEEQRAQTASSGGGNR
jgi:DNA (cytosine-5)-methyltransferase 1